MDESYKVNEKYSLGLVAATKTFLCFLKAAVFKCVSLKEMSSAASAAALKVCVVLLSSGHKVPIPTKPRFLLCCKGVTPLTPHSS